MAGNGLKTSLDSLSTRDLLHLAISTFSSASGNINPASANLTKADIAMTLERIFSIYPPDIGVKTILWSQYTYLGLIKLIFGLLQ
jgi:hypothetical protein